MPRPPYLRPLGAPATADRPYPDAEEGGASWAAGTDPPLSNVVNQAAALAPQVHPGHAVFLYELFVELALPCWEKQGQRTQLALEYLAQRYLRFAQRRIEELNR
jgi:hypothetical protein